MGGWTIFCMISGVAANGGPETFLDGGGNDEEIQTLASKLAEHLSAVNSGNAGFLPQEEIESTLIEALEEDPIPPSMSSWCEEVVVFGQFYDEEQEDYLPGLRFCSLYVGHGSFASVRSEDGDCESENEELMITDEPLAFMDSRCWHYLLSWLDLPPRRDGETPAPFHEELWTVINLKGRKTGDFIDLNYGSEVTNAWGQYSTYLLENCEMDDVVRDMCLEGLPYLSSSLSQGLRGAELRPALLADFQTWAFESPNLWPSWTNEIKQLTVHSFSAGPYEPTSSPAFSSLPLELLMDILTQLSVIDVLNLSSTCKVMHHNITHDDFLPMLLRDMIQHGSLRWLKPCHLVEDEVKDANEELASWIPGDAHSQDPLQDLRFPFLTFVRHCYVECYSMRNRRRLWRIIKELEGWIVAYRLGKDT
ncbi:hypothetical protein DL96DRAFT_1713488 [Flagelloscypha sp. PMI_526]|nr:hypothetical protein DL96DRAFT_1713488 [Flagelloscypha sp. PMI_526]